MNIGAINRQQQVFAAVPKSAHAARAFVGETLRQRDVPKSIIHDYQLAVSELVTNAIEHGDGSGLIVFTDFSDPQWWEVGVVGGTPSSKDWMRRPNKWTVGGKEHSSGRGLGIVRQLMDDVVAEIIDARVSVRCRRRRVEI